MRGSATFFAPLVLIVSLLKGCADLKVNLKYTADAKIETITASPSEARKPS